MWSALNIARHLLSCVVLTCTIVTDPFEEVDFQILNDYIDSDNILIYIDITDHFWRDWFPSI